MISITNFARRLAENSHWITETYLLFFYCFPAPFNSFLFLILLLFFSKFSDAARCIVLSVRGLAGDLATHVAKIMANKREAVG